MNLLVTNDDGIGSPFFHELVHATLGDCLTPPHIVQGRRGIEAEGGQDAIGEEGIDPRAFVAAALVTSLSGLAGCATPVARGGGAASPFLAAKAIGDCRRGGHSD